MAVRGRLSSRALLWVILAMIACEYEGASTSTSTLLVVVRVEPTVVPTSAFPAQVLVSFDSSGSGSIAFRVGVLCAPPAMPFELTTQLSQPADATSVVHAWLAPIDSAPPCGALPEPQVVPFPPAAFAGARTTGDLEVLAGCGSGDVRSTILVLGGTP